jgi:Ca2+-binding RTX toxin-like protein
VILVATIPQRLAGCGNALPSGERPSGRGAGADHLERGGGDDVLFGGQSDDTLDAGTGADRLPGGERAFADEPFGSAT